MMIGSILLEKVCVVFWWDGFSGARRPYRWGREGGRYPTYYLGPLRMITGPGFDDGRT